MLMKNGDYFVIYGYARVSTLDQKLDGQIALLKSAECTVIYKEKKSGADAARPELKKLLAAIGQGDTIIITRLDRLARSTIDLLRIMKDLDERGVSLKSLADSWLDTTTAAGKLIITIFAGLAEFERALIKERTAEGLARAKERGVVLGRKRKMSSIQIRESVAMRSAGRSFEEIAEIFGISRQTVAREISRREKI
ncbi:recombinase family protein [Brucella pseudogrignonensis]|uniref:DNA invertase Pin-like site-specific DNA recombinase n=1 Tax=Brucella pseudogrignonensis TaxID=419475 RepID=A0ABU1MF25_9HYPH|nr:recombinase family protein [Brucella pseudogrignonensis]MDR6434647.1 DNA invertase Pin-like site-specific DNA recombinase [Brucella pseudogrignonensis]